MAALCESLPLSAIRGATGVSWSEVGRPWSIQHGGSGSVRRSRHVSYKQRSELGGLTNTERVFDLRPSFIWHRIASFRDKI